MTNNFSAWVCLTPGPLALVFLPLAFGIPPVRAFCDHFCDHFCRRKKNIFKYFKTKFDLILFVKNRVDEFCFHYQSIIWGCWLHLKSQIICEYWGIFHFVTKKN
jgi:hypothetical protein